MLYQRKLEEQINNEFHAGFLYLSMEDEELAREKIESGMKYFNFLQLNDDRE